MTLIEQNGKLAKFMGLFYKGCDVRIIQEEWPHTYWTRAKYDTSWDWIMPVVEKLESMGFALHIDEDRVFLHLPRNHEMMDFTKEECGSKIATVYKAVCAGVEWIERLDKTAKAL